MFQLFKRKSKKEKLEAQFKKLMKEWHELSSINRSASDQKFAEAQMIAKTLNEMNEKAA